VKEKLFIFLFFSNLLTGENFQQIDTEGMSLWEARNYSEAKNIYESLSSIAPWQQARILYNLGTIELSQNNPWKAIHYYHEVRVEDLLLSDFGKNFALNVGISYYQSAKYFAESSVPFIEEARIFLTQSMNSMNLAEKWSCDKEVCEENPIIDFWKKKIQNELDLLQKSNVSDASKVNENKELFVPLLNALTQAHVALQTYLLMIIQNNAMQKNETVRENVIQEQQKVTDLGALFIPAILKNQQDMLQLGKKEHCSKYPWGQIIPLFDQGMQLAKGVLLEMQQAKWNPEVIQSQQIQTIRDWTHARNLLENAPEKTEDNSTTISDFITNTQKLQEMFLQDEKRSNNNEKEFHSW
jgi:hypothetical protein